ncbi:hypothetical protein H2199_004316 [Coniosporium tulheliwenetii]|uniref:Uncharacterized protein n=1 Tax=Coniosporium tulheliwenetii TaxID=3383036 RepID=A0ACC2Z8H9_9PEZI|nr:hypothetical protein H2199_004316 [Cladosporium sp. JES 115]
MTSVADSVIFRKIFSTEECAAIWSDKTRTSYYLSFEAALAKVQAELGIIPQKAADEIGKHCRLEEFDFEELEKQTVTIGYPVLPVVKQLVKNDVTDTATILQLRDTLKIVESDLTTIIQSLEDLCQRYRETPMAARSNLQQAVPMTFGFKLARLLATFKRHEARLRELYPRLLVLEFSGAAGTLATLCSHGHDKALDCQELLAAELGLEVPDIAWHTERDRITEVGNFFAMLTATCAKFALDVKLLMQTEVGEVSEPYVPHRGSSSTMPQKRNPIGCAYITAMAATVRQLAASLVEAMVEDHERSTGPWEIEWIVLPQISTLTCATLRHTVELLVGLEVHPDAMVKNLEITKGTIVSEAVMMGLGEEVGRQYAHDLVYDLCRRAQIEDRPLLDLLDECEEVKLDREELEKLCDPANYLGLSVEMVDRVLRA